MKGIHFTAFVEPRAMLRSGVEILQFTVVREGADVGAGTRVCSHCYIDADVTIGARCKIKNGVRIFKGVTLGNDVFIGPNVTFTNDHLPRAYEKHTPPYPRTVVKDRATVGAGAVILPGIIIGREAVVGAGAVVTRDVPDGMTVVGNPARDIEYVKAMQVFTTDEL